LINKKFVAKVFVDREDGEERAHRHAPVATLRKGAEARRKEQGEKGQGERMYSRQICQRYVARDMSERKVGMILSQKCISVGSQPGKRRHVRQCVIGGKGARNKEQGEREPAITNFTNDDE
jgi:hypothetical protein